MATTGIGDARGDRAQAFDADGGVGAQLAARVEDRAEADVVGAARDGRGRLRRVVGREADEQPARRRSRRASASGRSSWPRWTTSAPTASATSRRSFTQKGTPAARQRSLSQRPASRIAAAPSDFARSCRQQGRAASSGSARRSTCVEQRGAAVAPPGRRRRQVDDGIVAAHPIRSSRTIYTALPDQVPPSDRAQADRRSAARDRGAVRGPRARRPAQVLLGITGCGKTFTVANVIEQHPAPDADHRAQQDAGAAALRRVQGAVPRQRRPLLRQLLRLLPARGVRPVDRHVHREGLDDQRRDRPHAPRGDASRCSRGATCIIVASVSCIYGIGAAEAYRGMKIDLDARQSRCGATPCCAGSSSSSTSATTSTSTAARSACAATSSRSSPPTSARRRSASSGSATRSRRSPRSIRCAARCKRKVDEASIFPGVALRHARRPAGARRSTGIKDELRGRLVELKTANKLVEEQRLEQRTMYDLEMLEQMGRCKGIENYSRHLSGRAPGEPPPTLIDYFPKDYLLFVDESHQTVPQVGGDVQRRPLAQGDARRVRLPPAVGARQPAAAVRRVGGARAADDLRVGDAGRVRARAGAGRGRRADHPADRPARSRDRGAAGGAAGRRPARRDPRARQGRRARARARR